MSTTTVIEADSFGQLVLVEADPVRQELKRAMTGFLAGYRTEAPFDRSLLETIPIFLRLQSVLLYAYARRLGEEGDDEAAFFARTRPLILAGRSPIPFDPAEVD